MTDKKFSLFRHTLLALIVAAVCIPAMAQVAVAPSMDELRKPFGDQDAAMFKSPPKINYPQTWFHFIGGNVSKEGITADLEAIAGAGFSGVQFFHGQAGGPWPGVEPQITSLSPSWDETVKHLAEECKRLGLRFTMQNCPGWATSGGPWITPQNAMRHLVWSRTDMTPSDGPLSLPKPQPSDEPWRDYTDVAVLAFPTPFGDTGGPLIPQSVSSNRELPWLELMSGTNRGGAWTPESAPGDPIRIEVAFADPVTVRTLELPSINQMNHHRNYEPGITVALDAIAPDGTAERVMHCVVPAANSQDSRPLSLACTGEKASDRYVITIDNRYPMMIGSLKMFSAARKNWMGV